MEEDIIGTIIFVRKQFVEQCRKECFMDTIHDQKMRKTAEIWHKRLELGYYEYDRYTV